MTAFIIFATLTPCCTVSSEHGGEHHAALQRHVTALGSQQTFWGVAASASNRHSTSLSKLRTRFTGRWGGETEEGGV